MGLLRLAVLGTPEVVHDESRLTFSLRKAQALLLYLAVEGGLHPRSKLAAFLWPDSAPHDARTALRNAIALLRSLLADASSAGPSHLLSQQDLLGLDPQVPLWLDLDVVQQAYQQVQEISTVPAEPQRPALVSTLQHALSLVRGPFLEGFWLGEEVPFDAWHEKQQQQWQVRLQVLFERLSCWQEAAGELEQARATLAGWLALDPLEEEAARRLMRLHLARGEPSAALQVYATFRGRLAQALQVEPSPQTVALAEHIRSAQAGHPGSSPSPSVRAITVKSRQPSELNGPLIGRTTAFSQLVDSFQLARQGQPQVVLVVGEAGIGKTRLASEFLAWAHAQEAKVLSGYAFEMRGRLPYQPLVEAIRPPLEEENVPKDLLDDLWLAELSRLLPQLRVRYPDLPAPTEDELTAKVRLFEAMARLLDALAKPASLVLLLDDLQWADADSLDLLRYLARFWKGHGTPVLLLCTVRSEEFNPQLSTQLADLGRDLPITQVILQPLSRAETLQLVQTIVGVGARGRSGGERRQPSLTMPSTTEPEASMPLIELGEFLFAHTGGQPFYLLETLKLLRDQQWLVPRLAADGTWQLELAVAPREVRSRRGLLPASVRTLILARLAKLSPAARQLVMASAVLGYEASAELLWQLADLGGQAGLEALEEAVKSGFLREEEAEGPGADGLGSYRFAHELIRNVVYIELGEARRHLLLQRALPLGEQTMELKQEASAHLA